MNFQFKVNSSTWLGGSSLKSVKLLSDEVNGLQGACCPSPQAACLLIIVWIDQRYWAQQLCQPAQTLWTEKGWPLLCPGALRSTVSKALSRHPIDPKVFCNQESWGQGNWGRCKGLLPLPLFSSSLPLILNVAEGWALVYPAGREQCQISHRSTDWCQCASCRKARRCATLLFIV